MINENIQDPSLKDSKFRDLFLSSFQEASVSLSTLTNMEIMVHHLELKILDGKDFINHIEDGIDELYIGSTVKVMEKPNTSIVFLIAEEESLRLYDKITGNEKGSNEVTKEIVSGIGEVNNILSSAFINNLANNLKREICPSTPLNVFDMQGAILEGVIFQENFINSKILCGETLITEKGTSDFKIRFFILTDKTELFSLLS